MVHGFTLNLYRYLENRISLRAKTIYLLLYLKPKYNIFILFYLVCKKGINTNVFFVGQTSDVIFKSIRNV